MSPHLPEKSKLLTTVTTVTVSMTNTEEDTEEVTNTNVHSHSQNYVYTDDTLTQHGYFVQSEMHLLINV